MPGLGPLDGESPEPMTGDDFAAIRKRLRDTWTGHVTLEKKDVEQLLEEIRWLKRRLQRVEHVLEPMVNEVPGRRK
jgi:hypothetical protein